MPDQRDELGQGARRVDAAPGGRRRRPDGEPRPSLLDGPTEKLGTPPRPSGRHAAPTAPPFRAVPLAPPVPPVPADPPGRDAPPELLTHLETEHPSRPDVPAHAAPTELLTHVGPPAHTEPPGHAGPPEPPAHTGPPEPPAHTGPPEPPAHAGPAQGSGRSRRRWAIPAAVVGLLALVYLVDLVMSRGEVPRGVTVSGVAVGGMAKADAELALRSAIEPGLRRDIPIRAGAVHTQLSPAAAGLKVDWARTVAATGGQPLNPITRLRSFFTTRETPVVTDADEEALGDALDGINTLVHRDAVDGTIRFDGLTPVAVPPTDGTDLDVPSAAWQIKQTWTRGTVVDLPVRPVPPAGNVSDDAIQRAISDVATPAVAAPVKVRGEGKDAELTPTAIAGALNFAPDGSGGLKPVLDVPELTDALKPQLASTERPAKDASVTLVGTRPLVTPSVDGHGVDYQATFAELPGVLRRTDNREITAVYADQPAKVTTEQIDELGIKDMISTFKTGGFAADSGVNIKRAAETINGKILKPGESFSLNTATGPRDAAQGYVPAGIIEDGHPARGIGGGVSQLATTLYNAAYFAGMTDLGHKEHSYYISRYPVAREATVFEGAIDLKFRNDLPTGVLIQTIWTPSDITVRFWGTKRYEVTSTPGPRTKPTPPQTLTVPAGQPCTPSSGGAGFTATDTRTMRDLTTGQTKSSTRTVRYKPSPKIVCAGATPPAGRAATGAGSSAPSGSTTPSGGPTPSR